MDAKTYPLQDILKPERRYLIPTFQRDYEWTREGQWQLLFEDLETTAERLLEARSAGSTTKERSVSPHFLGAVVCAGVPFATGSVALRSVIDGQQRLTTMELLARGLLDVLQANDSDVAGSVRRMLFNPSDVVRQPEEGYKLWPRRRDREIWPIAMGDEIPNYSGPSDHLYIQARKFFADSARTSVSDENGTVDTGRLTALADALMQLFKLVVIDLDDNDDAQVIFEVLNGRQTPLAAIDLVKNLLFLRGELDEEDVDRLYDRYWAPFDDAWWKQEVGRGHAQRGRRDVLLSVWLTAMTGTEANVGHLYREARDYLNEDDAPSTENVLQTLSGFASAYRRIYGAEAVTDPRLRSSYDRINAFDILTAVPLLVWLETLNTETLSADDHVRAVSAVESWAARRSYTGAQTRGYGPHLARVLREARTVAEADGDVAGAVVEGLDSGALGWPSDDDMHDAFRNRRFYGPMAQGRIRQLLGAIDAQQRSENPHEPTVSVTFDDLQIEHVMPQEWKTHWPLLASDGALLSESDPDYAPRFSGRQQIVDRLGNLTLVTGAFNRDVSNLGWSIKRPEFAKQVALALNRTIAETDDWDEDAIAARASELAAAACRVWPSFTVLGGIKRERSDSSDEPAAIATPADLSAELGIDHRDIRRYLRQAHALNHEPHARWLLTPDMAENVREHFGR